MPTVVSLADLPHARPIPAEQRRFAAKVVELLALLDALEIQLATARTTTAA